MASDIVESRQLMDIQFRDVGVGVLFIKTFTCCFQHFHLNSDSDLDRRAGAADSILVFEHGRLPGRVLRLPVDENAGNNSIVDENSWKQL